MAPKVKLKIKKKKKIFDISPRIFLRESRGIHTRLWNDVLFFTLALFYVSCFITVRVFLADKVFDIFFSSSSQKKRKVHFNSHVVFIRTKMTNEKKEKNEDKKITLFFITFPMYFSMHNQKTTDFHVCVYLQNVRNIHQCVRRATEKRCAAFIFGNT